MKIVIVNGSARKGNTLSAIEAFKEGISKEHEVEVISSNKLDIAPCKGCGACKCTKGCVDQDDTNPTIDKLVSADVIVFATPVYWWGMTAQTKLIIDKCFCKAEHLKNKKVGVFVIGADSTNSIQYELINKQFNCISEYLSWDMLFQKAYSAYDKTDLSKNIDAINEIKTLGSNL